MYSDERHTQRLPPQAPETDPAKAASPDGRCVDCTHSRWLVALGLGFRCLHPLKNPGGTEPFNKVFPIPNRHYGCSLFDPRALTPRGPDHPED